MPRLNLVAPFPQTSRTRGDAGVHVSKWPIRAAYLRALADLGLSDPQIAAYLQVDRDKVASVRNLFRIPEGK
jgi:hypothetical protein